MSAYYSFLPHLRQGLADVISNPDNYSSNSPSSLSERAKLPLNISLLQTAVSGGDTTVPLTQQVMLKGPGDIIGINSSEIVKVFPTNWTTNFEPNYLPYIEFYDEDFPWRYTPARANLENTNDNRYRLRPWISLVVLKENEFENLAFNGILPSINVTAATNNGAFPDEHKTWAWAHVHVNGDLGTSTNDPATNNIKATDLASGINSLQQKLKDNPDCAVARILCPRRLEPNTSYYAFLVPTFELGRKAGLGISIGATDDPLEPAWHGNTIQKQFPVYHQWFFKTGVSGDFESLVRKLKPTAMGNEVGKRAIDLQLPGNPVLDLTAPVDTIGLQGVLHPVGQTPDSWAPVNNFSSKLKDILNAPAAAQAGSPDPVIGPPIYGRWHAQVNTISGDLNPATTNWINTANLDPRFRTFAGAGAEVVRKNQDKYMSIAWSQIGEVLEANRKLRQMQLALQASLTLHTKHIRPLGNEVLLTLSSAVHTKIKAPVQTIYKEVADSAIPNSMFSGAFRRITNPGSAFSRGMSGSGITINAATLIQDVNSGAAVIAPPYTAPGGMISYSILAPGQLTPGYTAGLPPIANFAITAPGISFGAPVFGPPSPAAAALVSSVIPLNATISTLAPYTYSTGPSLNMSSSANTVSTSINPQNALFELAQKQVKLFDPNSSVYTAVPSIDTVLAAPRIDLPMYQALAELSTEWLMPGLKTIADNTISLLEMDQKYIEAYMLGLNYEMARELLWRGYPTDQRGTCFQFFWGYSGSLSSVPSTSTSLDNYKDIYPIHKWRNSYLHYGPLTKLGNNSPRLNALGSGVSMLILTIRGELFRRYPGVKIYMQKAKWQYNTATPPQPLLGQPRIIDGSAPPLYPVFSAQVYPDVYFLGFPIDATTAKGAITDDLHPGYFFVFEEQAGALKFGADEVTDGVNYTNSIASGSWNDLNWGHIKSNPAYAGYIDPAYELYLNVASASYPDGVRWGRNSAGLAYALLQLPVKLDVHAKELIV
ncbi:hypothetical protein [Taibaiella chishuiensis]|uniref:Uncharacterized protein n=1 Tax=Taibaiella chishuiensis TaxID=1434707 RepID=A0A2P8CT48_9BACT|nr:hypothetical protein [Taibaiella chishuiensis]PSK88145.1 hypothetical protein B0I18_11539 [Taibaiella chishuiensis]